MNVAILGGKLQGVEVAYLAKKAGWHTVVVDMDPQAPARGICDEFLSFDLMEREPLLSLMGQVDLVLPAIEDKDVLNFAEECAGRAGVRFVYDRDAYLLSSSKIRSDSLFEQLGIAAPQPWPLCDFPITVKPSGESGSKGVHLFHTSSQFEQWLLTVPHPEKWVKQEFLQGPSYSIEVIGSRGHYRTFQITELEMDAGYDCKRVLAPALLSPELEIEFHNIATALARTLKLNGIMDVEVILHGGKLKVLEIDARIPSQTPTAVYHASGMNLIEMLADNGAVERPPQGAVKEKSSVVFEHILVQQSSLAVCGEHIMADAGPLSLHCDFFGADEALTNYTTQSESWVATLINRGETLTEAREKRDRVITTVCNACGIDRCIDLPPVSPVEAHILAPLECVG